MVEEIFRVGWVGLYDNIFLDSGGVSRFLVDVNGGQCSGIGLSGSSCDPLVGLGEYGRGAGLGNQIIVDACVLYKRKNHALILCFQKIGVTRD